jgi:RadC-like JAB domain
LNAKRKKLGPVSAKEGQNYRARLGSDAEWGRPTDTTARNVWKLLKGELPVAIDDLLPKGKRLTGDEYDQAVLRAQQSLVIALDCAIDTEGRVRQQSGRASMLTQNLLFEALARFWSVRFRQATRKGVATLYDVSEETAKRVWREVLNAGIRVETLWQIVTGEWSRTQEAQNPLFWVSRVRGRGHARGWRVHARVGSLDLRTFDEAIQEDRQYRRRGEQRMLFAEDWKARERRLRQKFCAERPYNIVNLQCRSCHSTSRACADDGREHFWAVLLSAQLGYLMHTEVSGGTLNASLVHPREVFGPALREGRRRGRRCPQVLIVCAVITGASRRATSARGWPRHRQDSLRSGAYGHGRALDRSSRSLIRGEDPEVTAAVNLGNSRTPS